MAKWVLALRSARRAPAAAPALHEALPTDAPFAAAHGRDPRPSPVAAVACLWSDAAPGAEAGGDAWRVDEVVHWDAASGAPAGLVLFCFVRRRAGLSREAFRTRYAEGHAPLARVHHPGVCRYVQNFVEGSSPGAPEIDAVAELHFASERDLRERLYRDASSPGRIADDVGDFLDPRAGFAVVTRPERAP